MRGKRNGDIRLRRLDRIIPAHAGQTRSNSILHRVKTDHPRACGANITEEKSRKGYRGSSPRMRGKPASASESLRLTRIIPAHAGQTHGSCRCRLRSSDHPRACGANAKQAMEGDELTGSSPRMRGKRAGTDGISAAHRIIPAHAGQTETRRRRPRHTADHPRACGANLVEHAGLAHLVGSSPRMRGKLSSEAAARRADRIIPAHAGQTSRSASGATGTTDHPRACGANGYGWRWAALLSGSSPRMRGKLRVGVRRGAGTRIIPAHAGQTWRRMFPNASTPDHPRACGAN